jgi:hypothetical protein
VKKENILQKDKNWQQWFKQIFICALKEDNNTIFVGLLGRSILVFLL